VQVIDSRDWHVPGELGRGHNRHSR
jgi:hypothetical protein